MPVREPVSVSCQDSWQSLDDGIEQGELNKRISSNLTLIRDDIQRSVGSLNSNPPRIFTSGNHQLVVPVTGIADVWAISDTTTAGSVAGVTTTRIGLSRNGLALTSGNLYQFTTAAGDEFASHGGGRYLNRLAVAVGDVLTLTVATTGAPAPTLTTANLMLRITLQDN
jgi:hypothetical protein